MRNKRQIELIGKEFRGRILGLISGLILLSLSIFLLGLIGNINDYDICRDDMDEKYNVGCIEPIDYLFQQAGVALFGIIAILSIFGGCTLIAISLTKLGFNFER